MLITLALFAVLGLAMGLVLFLARILLDFLLVTLGVGPVIRWQFVTFATVLFWSWYFAPRLLALN